METEQKLAEKEIKIRAKDRIIAWPRMGRIDIPLKALVQSLIKVQIHL